MNIKIVCGLTIAIVSSFAAIAEARELQISTPEASIIKHENGSMEINTGNNRIRTPNRGDYPQINQYNHRSYRYRSYNRCYSRNITQNSVTQVTRSGRTVINSSISTNQCD